VGWVCGAFGCDDTFGIVDRSFVVVECWMEEFEVVVEQSVFVCCWVEEVEAAEETWISLNISQRDTRREPRQLDPAITTHF
jgi:hypothetical protein